MKKLITLALIIGATTFTQAQNNLVFNQVLDFRVTNSVSVTVPEGKVWKVEHTSSGQIFATKTDVPYGVGLDNSSYNGTAQGQNAIWFSEGTVLATTSSNLHLSILEFNVVPISTTTGGSGGGVSADGLVFSGIINQFIPTSSVTGIGTVAGSFTVPEGKIWKISTMSHKKIAGSGDIIAFNGSLYVGMDGVPIYAISSSINVNSAITNNVILTPGTYELKWYASNGANHYCGTNTHLVAIEYNIP